MKATIISIIVAIALVSGAIILVNKNSPNNNISIPADNVSIVDGKQIIEINAKGGYQPRKSIAKSNIPTIIRFNTNNTFDCSSFVVIPSMSVRKYLPQSGSADIDIGTKDTGRLIGSCGMGMYPFEVEFI